MIKRAKRISALVLAATLACSMLVLPEAYAANEVDVEAKCSIQVNCNKQYEYNDAKEPVEKESKFEEVSSSNVNVELYRVATIDITGNYTAVSAFGNVKIFEGIAGKERTFAEWISPLPSERDSHSLSSSTPAGDWADVAVALDNALSDSIQPTATATPSETITGLQTGLYLVVAKELVNGTSNCRYEFAPYLVSLPNNYYDKTGDDTWDYELVGDDAVGLKPQQFDRYGYLVIQKDLINYDETNPSAVFVFEVTAKKGKDLVFNDVVAIDFTNKGTDYIKVGPIVAGAEVTVKEVYQGASYEQVSVKPEKAQVIVANTYWDECKDYKEAMVKSLEPLPVNDAAVSVQNKTFVKFLFTNEHGDVPNGGTGVVNTFEAGETSWSASQEYQGQSGNAQ